MRRARETFFLGALWGPPLLAILLVLTALVPVRGKLGHDYYHFFTRLYIGAVHFWQNGFAIPHYTPSLCGGIPFFADPQSVYYSLPQLLTFFVDPLPATLLSVAIFYLAGYLGFLLLAREVFAFGAAAAHLGALLFLLNGFSFAHLYVGHFTHHAYLLFPWVLFFFFRGRAVPFSLCLIYTFYSGGGHVLVVFAVGLFLALPTLLARRKIRECLAFGVASGLALGLACSGKLVASALFSHAFFYRGVDSSGASLSTVLLRYFWFDPAATPLRLPFGDMVFGPWEYVGFVSKLTLPALIAFPVLLVRHKGRRALGQIAVVAGLASAVLLIASGGKANLALPFFRHYHNPIKILGAFIPFFCLISAYVVDRALRWPALGHFSRKSGPVFYLLVALILVAEFRNYILFFSADTAAHGYVYSSEIYQKLRESGRLPPVTRVIAASGADDVAVMGGCTSLRCYEPLFGYQWEAMKPSVVPGPTSLVQNGRLNLTHPGCFLYPGYFHCQAWDRVPIGDRDTFERFSRGDLQAWGVPPWQSWLLHFNFIFIAGLSLEATGLRRRISRLMAKPLVIPFPMEEGA